MKQLYPGNMKRLAISLTYNGTTYMSNYDEFNEKDEMVLNDAILNIVSGKSYHLSFKKDNKTYYFPEAILKQSILTIVDAKVY